MLETAVRRKEKKNIKIHTRERGQMYWILSICLMFSQTNKYQIDAEYFYTHVDL